VTEPAWVVLRRRASAGELHRDRSWTASQRSGGDPEPARPARVARLASVVAPAIVLGSSQPEEHLDRAAVARTGVEIVRRHSGGAAVFVAPGAQVWLDVFLPAGDRLIEADVATACHFLGQWWALALEGAAAIEPGRRCSVHRGRFVPGSFGRRVCFSGLGPGEVSVDGAKVVGIAQRRDRSGVLFHSLAYVEDVTEATIELLSLERAEREQLESELAAATTVARASIAALHTALLEALPG
jgi:lipoate-protein ligase A